MNKIKAFFSKFADMAGFKRNSKYVNAYIHKANIRSGLFMAAVVAILEVWLVIRQHDKYIISLVQGGQPYFYNLFKYTSLFWLLMVMGISMFLYCFNYLHETKGKGLELSVIVSSAIGIVLCCLLPLEQSLAKFSSKLVDNILLVSLYGAILAYHVVTIVSVITRSHGKNIDWLQAVMVITLFATCLLIFGIKVSYGDFTSMKGYGKLDANGKVIPGTEYFDIKTGEPLIDANGRAIKIANQDYKQIICFLMMAIYVGCLLIWKPYISVAILGVIFLGFYLLVKSFDPNVRSFPDGDEVNYITFFISLAMVSISIFNQRLHEARNDEELELLATVDKLTGLSTYGYFLKQCEKVISMEPTKQDEYAFLFLNVSLFKVYNDQKGYAAGNELLKNVGSILRSEFKDAIISRQSDDHYVVFTKNEELTNKLDHVRAQVKALDEDIKPNICIGYYLTQEHEEDAHASIEKARYACSELKRSGHDSYLSYDHKMHDRYNLVQYIVSNVDKAVEEGWIVAYYQPVVFSKSNDLCGVEALARWIDPKYGFLNPGVFIGALEDAHLAYKVDLAMLEIVCKNMRKVLDQGEEIVPTSINFSRADFSVVDLPNEIVRITNKYQIPTKYLHVEITESALIDEEVSLTENMKRIQENGFEIWLDDFGSGYSSFNAIKDYSFNVVKLDMAFLKGLENNEKAKLVIQSVINMADSIGMHTLCEGVETKQQSEFLKKIGCEKQQGYLFSKPISFEDLNNKIRQGELVIAKKLFN